MIVFFAAFLAAQAPDPVVVTSPDDVVDDVDKVLNDGASSPDVGGAVKKAHRPDTAGLFYVKKFPGGETGKAIEFPLRGLLHTLSTGPTVGTPIVIPAGSAPAVDPDYWVRLGDAMRLWRAESVVVGLVDSAGDRKSVV